MPRKRNPVPSYLHHRPTGQAYVRIGKKFTYLGPYGSAESKAKYTQIVGRLEVVAEVETVPTLPLSQVGETITDLAAAFCDAHLGGYSQSERDYYRSAIELLLAVAGSRTAAEFGPRALAEVRERMVAKRWTREHVNAQVRRVRRVFRWAESVELAPAGKWHQLRTLEGLKAGKTTAPDQRKNRGVADEVVERTIPFLSPTVGAMVRFQRLTGCRPQDVCRLNVREIDRSRPVWVFRPQAHKTAWRGQDHTVYIGPRAQAVILPLILGREEEPAVFSPRSAWDERRQAGKKGGRTNYRPKGPPITVGLRFTTATYGRAVERAIARVNEQAARPEDLIPEWRPNDLRHATATEVRQKFGLEAAQKLLDHRHASTTEGYAKLIDETAERVAMENG